MRTARITHSSCDTHAFSTLTDSLKDLQPSLVGKPPKDVPVFASTFHRNTPAGGSGSINGSDVPDPKYAAAEADFENMFAISPVNTDGDWHTKWGYLDLRGYVGHVESRESQPHHLADENVRANERCLHRSPTQTLREVLQGYIDRGLASKIRAIKLGDEITLARPSGNASVVDPPYLTWAQKRGLTAEEIGCEKFDQDCHYNATFSQAVRIYGPEQLTLEKPAHDVASRSRQATQHSSTTAHFMQMTLELTVTIRTQQLSFRRCCQTLLLVPTTHPCRAAS